MVHGSFQGRGFRHGLAGVRRSVGLALLLLAGSVCATVPPKPAPAEEIGMLIGALRSSGCEFQRNGKWYGAGRAADHLQRKYDYAQRKGLVGSTEDFIEKAASRSSASGKAYQVRCKGAAPVPSAQWLTTELRRHRDANPRRSASR